MQVSSKALRVLRSNLLPWITVAVVVIVAFVLCALFVNAQQASPSSAHNTKLTAAKGKGMQQSSGDNESDAKNSQQQNQNPSNKQNQQSAPKPQVPQVDPGQTSTLHITQWGKRFQVSTKLGWLWYELKDYSTKAYFNSSLIDSLPESCAQQRREFGFLLENDTMQVLKPAQECAAAPDLYNEIWGLLEAAVKTAH